jgi:hypothetical protein
MGPPVLISESWYKSDPRCPFVVCEGAQVHQSSHAQEIFYVYITQQAYHDEKVNPTPTHERRTIVYQEMFSVRSQY